MKRPSPLTRSRPLSKKRIAELEGIEAAACAMVSWVFSPAAVKYRLIHEIAKTSGIHANHLLDLARLFATVESEL
jgi:hypothetical protein